MFSKVLTLWSPASGNTEQALFHALFTMGAALQSQPSDSVPSNPFKVVVDDVVAPVGDNPATQRLRAYFNPQIERYNAGQQNA